MWYQESICPLRVNVCSNVFVECTPKGFLSKSSTVKGCRNISGNNHPNAMVVVVRRCSLDGLVERRVVHPIMRMFWFGELEEDSAFLFSRCHSLLRHLLTSRK